MHVIFAIFITSTLNSSLTHAMAKRLPNQSNPVSTTPLPEDSYCHRLKEFASKPKWSLPSEFGEADQLVVDKSRHLLHVLSNEKLIRTYRVALGKGSPQGHKRKAGDNKTPEGNYFIEYKNSASDYHLSLKISYPNQDDINWARKNGVDPGGDIMIHGLPNSAIKRALINHPKDWTKGCVAVNNREIEEIFDYVHSGTPIELCR